ncbi:MAG TPA: hypothetical protein VK707_10330 [Solirubrobacteraceae bacterium]|nr:hypothetical protein [Solirubrobacteraceae bacterium]
MTVSLPARQGGLSSAEPAWPRGPREPSLARAAVHVWRAELTQTDARVTDALSDAERERAARLLDERARLRWSRSRGLLRALLGRYLQIEPGAVELRSGPHGKPELAEPRDGGRPALFFNLSHSRELALFAFTRAAPIGVDVQFARSGAHARAADRVALARRALGEQAALGLAALAADAREREFVRLWTRHEAELKRRGTGLGASAAGARARAASALVDLDVGSPAAAAALALGESASELRCWRWS